MNQAIQLRGLLSLMFFHCPDGYFSDGQGEGCQITYAHRDNGPDIRLFIVRSWEAFCSSRLTASHRAVARRVLLEPEIAFRQVLS